MGAELAIVGLRDNVLGGTAAFYETVAKNGIELNDDCKVLKTPSLRRIREDVLTLASEGQLHAIVGSSIELNLFSHAASVRSALSRTAMIETGFPSKNQHAALATPTLGYRGALVWAQRLIDAILTPKFSTRTAS
jgi:nitrogenase molybdenum-iron protein alpha/beta subunit